MGKYEIWERRPGGIWRAVESARDVYDGKDMIRRRVKHRKSFRFGNPAPSELVILPVGVPPHDDTVPDGIIE